MKYIFVIVLLCNSSTLFGQVNFKYMTTTQRQELFTSKTAQGIPATDFNIRYTDGKIQKLSDLRGKAVVLNFFFVGCSPCKAEIPMLNKVQQYFDSQKDDVVFLGISTRDSSEKVQAYFEKSDWNFEGVSADSVIMQNDKPMCYNHAVLNNHFGSNVHPTTLIIDREGRIQKAEIGYFRDKAEEYYQAYIKAIESALKND